MLERTRYADNETWLAGRSRGLGASDAAAACGLSPWKSNLELWEEKTGRKAAQDLSFNSAVSYGKSAEAPLRELFILDYPEYAVEYHAFDVLFQSELPWLTATLDAELIELCSGRRGFLEIKTAEPVKKVDWAKWAGKVPDYYYIQVLHQFAATGWDFCILKAQLKSVDREDGSVRTECRHYYFERTDHLNDIAFIVDKEKPLWQHVIDKTRPNLILPEIFIN